MQNNQPSSLSASANSTVQGDPAARKFGFFFLGTLAVVTIGAAIGIGVGNLAHYRYFAPYNQSSIDLTTIIDQTSDRKLDNEINAPLWLPLSKRLKKRDLSRKIRQF